MSDENLMSVEVLEERLLSDGFELRIGNRVNVPDEVGQRWCALGWAKDLAGKVATGERTTQNITINPKKLKVQQAATEVK